MKQDLNEIYTQIIKKSSTDMDFRKKLLDNPNLAIEELTGEKLPDDYKIKVIEGDPAYSATFVLPKLDNKTLNEADLTNIAGGMGDVSTGNCEAQGLCETDSSGSCGTDSSGSRTGTGGGK